jgi:hypothetical protein
MVVLLVPGGGGEEEPEGVVCSSWRETAGEAALK